MQKDLATVFYLTFFFIIALPSLNFVCNYHDCLKQTLYMCDQMLGPGTTANAIAQAVQKGRTLESADRTGNQALYLSLIHI